MKMPAALGLRVYTAFDAAFVLDDILHIVDWKTGKETEATRLSARQQLCAYALYGIWRGFKLEKIRVQAAWMAPGPPKWAPTEVAPIELRAIKGAIQDQNKLELERLEEYPVRVKSGAKFKDAVAYRAARSSFPPNPGDQTCGFCKYRLICQEKHGKAAILASATAEAAN